MRKHLVVATAAFGLAMAGGASAQTAAPRRRLRRPLRPPSPRPPPPTGVDLPYGQLMADPASRAVLARDIPNIVGYEAQDQIQTMTIRQIAHFPQAGIDDAKLATIQTDLTTPATAATLPPTAARPAS